jgi:lysophospholipase L1-like esterase
MEKTQKILLVKLKRYSSVVLINVVIVLVIFGILETSSYIYITHFSTKYIKKIDFPKEMSYATLGRYRLYRTHVEYHSEHYNTDENGFRATAGVKNILGDFNQSFYNIFVFGGSTTFGTFVRDDETWTYYLSAMLKNAGYKNVKVYNLGQGTFNIQDEIYLLFDQLRQRRVPNMVIFLEGVNLACPTNVDKGAGYRDELYGNKIMSFLMSRYSRHLFITLRYNFFNSAMWKSLLKLKHGTLKTIPRTYDLIDYQKCASDFMTDVNLINDILSLYNSKAYYFLQPSGYFLSNRQDYPFWIYGPLDDKFGLQKQQYYDAILSQKQTANVYDIRNILNEPALTNKDLFCDGTHPSGIGNSIIAKEIFRFIAGDIVKTKP